MKLTLLFLLFPFLIFSQTQIGQDLNGEAQNDVSSWGLSISSNGNIIAIGSPNNDEGGEQSGHVRVFENINDVWTQIGQDIDGETADDSSGDCISLSSDGSVIAISAALSDGDGNGNNTGHVRVFENINNTWTQIGQDIYGEEYFYTTGYSISLSSDGNIIAISSPGYSENGTYSGAVNIYENSGGIWTKLGQSLYGDGDYFRFGFSTSISSDGSIVAISAPYTSSTNPQLGYVRIYENINDVWTQIGNSINASNLDDTIGSSLSLSSNGSIIAIGNSSSNVNGNYSGQVQVFENINSVWTQLGDSFNGENGDLLGLSVSLSSNGSILAIGAPQNDVSGNNSGQVKSYKNINDVWTQIGNEINGEAVGDIFGARVSLSSNGSILAIGAPHCSIPSGDGQGQGQVRVYDFSDVLSTNEHSLLELNIYPNPTNSMLYIEASNTLTSIEIYNLLGQQILSNTPNTLTEEIDMSSFNTGMYLVKVGIGEQTATYKVLKK